MSKVKIIDRHSEKSIKGEREFLSKLHHPFIVNMNCAFQDYDNLYLVMDLLTGGDLRYHLCRIRKFTEEETKFFISNLLLGLEYIHNNNIIHRDIKPENLVSDDKGYIRITDFGVAKIYKEDNSSETSGTPGYMAPEVLMGQHHTFAVDFFAIGIIGYEFMFGTRPYNGKNRKEIKHLILKKQAKIDEDDTDWSSESVDFINKCLKRKDTKRLGYKDGIKELKNHKWFNGFDWDALFNKTILAPFVPKKEGNYDKKYCEMIEKCGEDTMERYNNYLNKKNFDNLFNGYTFVNMDLIQTTFNSDTRDTHTRFTTNSKHSKPTNSNNYSNKKEKIKNINFNNIRCKNINKNNNIVLDNYKSINLNPNNIQKQNYFINFKRNDKNNNKPIKPDVIAPINYQEIHINNNKKNKENISNEANLYIKDSSINDNINNKLSINQNKKSLGKSPPSISNFISTPQNGRKLKLDKNNSFFNLKGDSNLFNNNNNIQNINHIDTNLSSLLSSNSIVNFNNVKFQNTKDKKNVKSTSIDNSNSNINNNMSSYGLTQKTNKNNIINENCKKKINQLCYNFSKKDLNGSMSERSPGITSRNKYNLRIMFKGDNSYRLNSSLLSPQNKNEHNSINIKNKVSPNSTKVFTKIKTNNYIQLRQINKDNSKNILPFHLPNLEKLSNNKRVFIAFNFENFKKKGKINLSNLRFKLKNKKNEKYFLVNKQNKSPSKMKRSESTLLFGSQINLGPKINNFINKNHGNKTIEKKNSTIMSSDRSNYNDLKEKRIRKNASGIF